MPKTKNQAKNKSRFEVRGGLLNEYEFALNEGAMTEEERNRLAQIEEERQLREGVAEDGADVPASPQEREAARIKEVMETAHEKAQRNIEKRERRAAASSKGGAGKSAARKRASKAGKKSAAKKGGKAGASKKGGASKGAGKGARKSAGKKASTKKGGRSGRR
ncbi:MAG: hypothetical protein ICV60_06760 [Pyrinomonadaceae bacterium]|nr:hypothetical protein [Pyrinomonadaceae bacterium]